MDSRVNQPKIETLVRRSVIIARRALRRDLTEKELKLATITLEGLFFDEESTPSNVIYKCNWMGGSSYIDQCIRDTAAALVEAVNSPEIVKLEEKAPKKIGRPKGSKTKKANPPEVVDPSDVVFNEDIQIQGEE